MERFSYENIFEIRKQKQAAGSATNITLVNNSYFHIFLLMKLSPVRATKSPNY
jgi:hypothetical protein